MRYGRMWVGSITLAFAGHCIAGSQEVVHADLPSWALPSPTTTDTPAPAGAPLRITYSDFQIRLGPDGDEVLTSYRLKVLQPKALGAGNVSVSWMPDAGEVKVHHVQIIRDAQVIDVLKSTQFEVLRREAALEKAVLSGVLTATLQAPGLQVGDELAFAATVRHKDPTLGDHSFGFAALPAQNVPGSFRIRLIWPSGRKIHWRASKDIPTLSPIEHDGEKELVYELKDPRFEVVADGAPTRLNIRRLIEYSDFDSWREVSARLWPLFDKASMLSAQSPIRQEVAHIAASSNDPLKRIEAALQLVEDRIRYVYVGLDGGNFTPATADETWERRFGDCKGKTALLLSILRELGIQGEPVVVNTQGADGIDERLPTPALFDHVLVRAHAGRASYWLDGTRSGDKSLEGLPPPLYRWALPLTGAGHDLESVPLTPLKAPAEVFVVDVDATRGFTEKARVKVQHVLRGDAAMTIHAQIAGLSPEDVDRELKSYWRKSNSDIEMSEVSWQYDERQATLLLTATGEQKQDWEGSEGNGYALDVPGAGFRPPHEFHRPKEQDQAAPWTTDYPSYRCWVTTLRVPKGNADWKWDYAAEPVNLRMGGIAYWRTSDLRDGVLRTVMSKRVEVPEITAAQAEEANKRIPTFNNKISRIFQILADEAPASHDKNRQPPFDDNTNWTSPTAPCGEAAK